MFLTKSKTIVTQTNFCPSANWLQINFHVLNVRMNFILIIQAKIAKKEVYGAAKNTQLRPLARSVWLDISCFRIIVTVYLTYLQMHPT